MRSIKPLRTKTFWIRVMPAVLATVMTTHAYSYQIDESNSFIEGLGAYQQGTYPSAITRLENWLQEYPGSSIRDLCLYWLAQACYQAGKQQQAARYMSQFFREYPEHPLVAIADKELKNLAKRYENR